MNRKKTRQKYTKPRSLIVITLLHVIPLPNSSARNDRTLVGQTSRAAAGTVYDQLYNGQQLMTVEKEIAFWRAYFAELLRMQGVTEKIASRGDELFDAFWLKGSVVYVRGQLPVLDWFAAHGYRMGVISDTFPSLKLTLEAVRPNQILRSVRLLRSGGRDEARSADLPDRTESHGRFPTEPVCGRLRRGGGRRTLGSPRSHLPGD
ncbi:MAG: hypothetical protein R2881_09655 [Eubacteriales bacterium]